ncbi:RNA-directed DNA polymerase [Micromonospora sp. NPDC048830]|uniref:RNA-directed DNA polymerase n=1 Tax=Micromonospora sp. NPDC048830 TaxID=3364257 RepID=UPI0037134041
MKLADSRDIARCLDLAWEQVGTSDSDLDLPDVINFADTDFRWEAYRQTLLGKILAGDYKPASVDIVDLPKNILTVRPLSRLSLDRRLAYEAAVLAAAPQIDKIIPASVYSSRWWKRQQRLLGPVGSWLRMQREARSLHKREPSLLLARTDVTAFYEYVDNDILTSDLESISIPGWSVELISNFLDAFNHLGNAWGIPQGFDTSGLLANLYLLPVDSEISRNRLKHFRYSDDIYIFGNSWVELRQAIIDITGTLRNRHLTLSSSKTRIIPSNLIVKEFEEAEKDAINYGITVDSPKTRAELWDFFDRTVAEERIDPRDLKFALSQLSRVHDDYAVFWLTSNLGEIPHVSREALYYLAQFHREEPKLGQSVVELLSNSKLFLYPFAQQHLLIYLIRQGVRLPEAREVAWRLLLDRNKESFVREFAARYLGLFGVAGDGARLKQEFQQETHTRVRRALLVAIHEANVSSRQWLRSVANAIPELGDTAAYLKTEPAEIPLPITRKSYAWS